MQGIKFKLKDGTWDYYDPLNINDFSETEFEYILDMTYKYEIPKEEVEYFERYDLCDECGYELEDNICSKCAEEKELEQLKDGNRKV